MLPIQGAGAFGPGRLGPEKSYVMTERPSIEFPNTVMSARVKDRASFLWSVGGGMTKCSCMRRSSLPAFDAFMECNVVPSACTNSKACNDLHVEFQSVPLHAAVKKFQQALGQIS